MIRHLLILLLGILASASLATGAALNEPVEFEGRYRVVFDSREGPAIATLRLTGDGSIEGTFMTPTGDDGLLVGTPDGNRLVLRPADGSAGPVYDGYIDSGGHLTGTLTWASGSSDAFSAVRSPEAELPDLYGLTTWNDGVRAGELVFRDVDGESRSLADVAPGPAIVYIFGSWCHNCADATAFLNTLHDMYSEHGLAMVGIAFEVPTDFDAQADAVRRYVEAKQVRFPLLIAGQRDKEDATRVLRALDRVRAYPTFAFVDATGEVVAVHQGFIGPAAPETHAALTASFIEQIEALLQTNEDDQ